MDNRSRWQIRGDALIRFAMANAVSGLLPLYIVTEYPKSGGTWIGQILAEYLFVPFPRNRLPRFGISVQHAHYLSNPLLQNVLCVFRDGRDAMVSFYFHMLFENDTSSPLVVNETRRALKFSDYDDVRENLPKFIEYLFDKQSRSLSPFQFTWSEFVRSWIGRDVAQVRYEMMVEDGVAEFSRALLTLGEAKVDVQKVEASLDKFSFARQARRKPGSENKSSFLRRGVPGDWKNKFSREAATVFDQLAGPELLLLGYETDSNWVQSVD